MLLQHYKRWTLEFQLRLPGKQSTSCPAQIFSLGLIWRSLTSSIYLPPTCLHSSFHFQIPVASKCHPPSKLTKTTPGRFSGRRSEPHRQFCLKVRSDQPTGPITKTIPDLICPPLELFTSAEKSPIATSFLIGRPRNLWTYGYHPKERERTTRRHLWGDVPRCMPTYCLQSWGQ